MQQLEQPARVNVSIGISSQKTHVDMPAKSKSPKPARAEVLVALTAGILYASKDSHYSVFKAARMYRMKAVQVIRFATQNEGCPDLEVQWEFDPSFIQIMIILKIARPVWSLRTEN